MNVCDLICQLLLAYATLGITTYHGYAPRYDPGKMERVAARRGMPIVDCMISSPRFPLGTWLSVMGPNTGHVEYCRVTDVSADTDTTGRNSRESDRQRHIRLRREVELGYTEALRFCGRAAMRDPPERCPIIVVKLP